MLRCTAALNFGVAIIISLMPVSAYAASITPVVTKYCYLLLKGDIVEGDLVRLAAAYDAPRDMANPVWDGDPEPWETEPGLCLQSPGGSYSESLKIARYVIENSIPTIIDAGAECYSACAIIWLAGTTWLDAAFQSRHLHVAGKIGFHAPFNRIKFPPGQYDREVVEKANESAYRAIGALIEIPIGTNYFEDIVPLRLLSAMLKHGPDSLATSLTVGDAILWDLDLFGYAPPAVLGERDMCNACNHFATLNRSFDGGGTCHGNFGETPSGYAALFEGFGQEGLFSCAVVANKADGEIKQVLAGFLEEDDPVDESTMRYLPLWYLFPDDRLLTSLAR